MVGITLKARSRGTPGDNDAQSGITIKKVELNPDKTAVIVCDMWDTHHCISAAKRVVEMAPHMNEVLAGIRDKGALIIHAPRDCMAFYDSFPQRRRAQEAPHSDAVIEFKWNR